MKNSCKITLIDDDPISHLITSKIIQMCSDCEVEIFTDPVTALQQLKARANEQPAAFPDFILLDIDMPFMDGWQFLDEFQRLPGKILDQCSVMMLSSSRHAKEIEMASRYRVVKNFFSKPFTEEMVRTMLCEN